MPESWTHQFRSQAYKRIAEYEKFLMACGITPVAGTELEFHYTPQVGPNFRKLSAITEFRNSPLVEMLKREETMYHVGEIVIGRGPESRIKNYPQERFPSTIARATESAKKIVSQGSVYGMDINFSEQPNGKRIRSLQSNISLWKTSDKSPLFINAHTQDRLSRAPNELTLDCARALIEAHQALSALVSLDTASFKRYAEKDAAFGISRGKNDKSSIALRDNAAGSSPFTQMLENSGRKPAIGSVPSLYFEDRLASSEADPALAMLITLGGGVNGVKAYMQRKGLTDEQTHPSPEKLKAHINSQAFPEYVAPVQAQDIARIQGNHSLRIPLNHRDALNLLKKNREAREIMGDEFHKAFCAVYEQVTQTAMRR